MTDIFDGAHYSLLQESFITVGGEELPNWFFSDPHNIALGLSTDGFGPFKQHTKTAWPIILFNYNFPPKERFLKKNHISAGVIPGPKKPGDLDSFLWLLVQELLQLELGVCIQCHHDDCFPSSCISNCCLWQHSRSINGHAHEGSQRSFPMPHV